MSRSEIVRILGTDGRCGTAARAAVAGVHADAPVPIRMDDGRSTTVPRSALTPAGRDAYRLDTPAPAHTEPPPSGGIAVPVIGEELQIGKREVDRGGVRVRIVPSEREEAVDLPLEHRDVHVERIPIGREVEGPLPAREEDGQLIFPVVEQVAVVQKKWVLREEVRVRVERTLTHARETITLKAESAVVERLDARDEPRGQRRTQAGDEGATDQGA